MEEPAHRAILRMTGKVLFVIGLVDIAVMIYCITNSISYSSSLNIFAVVAGFFLLRGSLRAASVVRWFAVFSLAGACALVLAWPFMQPFSLTLTQIRLNPLATLAFVALLVATLLLLFWVQRQLGKPPIVAAIQAAGGKVRDMRLPTAMGAAIVALLATVVPFALSGVSGNKAESMVQQQLGAGYQYHVSSLNVSTSGQGKYVRATVTAWNEREVRTVPVEWSE